MVLCSKVSLYTYNREIQDHSGSFLSVLASVCAYTLHSVLIHIVQIPFPGIFIRVVCLFADLLEFSFKNKFYSFFNFTISEWVGQRMSVHVQEYFMSIRRTGTHSRAKREGKRGKRYKSVKLQLSGKHLCFEHVRKCSRVTGTYTHNRTPYRCVAFNWTV